MDERERDAEYAIVEQFESPTIGLSHQIVVYAIQKSLDPNGAVHLRLV